MVLSRPIRQALQSRTIPRPALITRHLPGIAKGRDKDNTQRSDYKPMLVAQCMLPLAGSKVIQCCNVVPVTGNIFRFQQNDTCQDMTEYNLTCLTKYRADSTWRDSSVMDGRTQSRLLCDGIFE